MPGLMRSYVAFDLQISKGFPDGVADWRPYRPFGISCAATVADNEQTKLWYSRAADGSPADSMSQENVAELVDYLRTQASSGKTILTWNGVGFDFDILAEESGLATTCMELALNHVDMMFHFFCEKGYLLGLDKAAKGMGLPGKTAGFEGALAPKYWQAGRRNEVLDYVKQDAITTLQLCRAVEKRGSLSWISNTGKSRVMPFRTGWLTVRQAMELPLPDTTWMKQPIKRNKFVGWITG